MGTLWLTGLPRVNSCARMPKSFVRVPSSTGVAGRARRGVCVGVMVLSSAADYPLGPQSDDHFQIKTTLSDPSLMYPPDPS